MKPTADNSSPIRFERFTWQLSPGAGSRATAALVASFLLFGPYLANVSRDYTRLCCFWHAGDTVSVIGLVLTVALLFFGAAELIRRTRQPLLTRLCSHLFLAVLGTGLLANLLFAASKLPARAFVPSRLNVGMAWVVLFTVLGYSFGNARCRLVLRARQFCQVVAPVVPLTFLGLALSNCYPENFEPLTAPPRVHAAQLNGNISRPGGVYVFLFDEWSYERTFSSGQVSARYPNVATFAGGATVYRNAASPAGNTEQSLPSILFQTAGPATVEHGRFGFERQGRFVQASEFESLFDRLQKLGRPGVVLGFGLPYRLWLGAGPQVCRSHCYYSRATSLVPRAAIHLLNAWHYSPEPVSYQCYKRAESRQLHSLVCGILSEIRQDVRTVIREWPADSFLFAHIHLPHMPAVMNGDLTFRTVTATTWRDDNLAGYESNLAALDAMLGEFITALRQAGKYDNAAIILTSDHSWRKDPDRLAGRNNVPVTHVPLLVKAPGQTTGACVDARFELTGLGELIESLVGSPATPDTLVMKDTQP